MYESEKGLTYLNIRFSMENILYYVLCIYRRMLFRHFLKSRSMEQKAIEALYHVVGESSLETED